MEYSIKAHPTTYKGTVFRSRLEARWACFMDLIGLRWEYEPLDLNGWTPDFRVEIRTGHSGCPDPRVLLAEVKPYHSIREFEGHPCMQYPYGQSWQGKRIPACSSAAFGANPDVSWWEWTRSNSSGRETIRTALDQSLVAKMDGFWAEAGNITRWAPDRQQASPRQMAGGSIDGLHASASPFKMPEGVWEVVVTAIDKTKLRASDRICFVIAMLLHSGEHAGEMVLDHVLINPENDALMRISQAKLKALGLAAGMSQEVDFDTIEALTPAIIGKRIKVRIRAAINKRTGARLSVVSTYEPLAKPGARLADLARLQAPGSKLADLARIRPPLGKPD